MQKKKAFLWGISGEILYKGSTFLAPIAYAIFAEKQDYAVFVYTLTLYTAAWIFIDLGIGTYGTRKVARNELGIRNFFIDVTIARLFLAFVVIFVVNLLLMNSQSAQGNTIWWALFLFFRSGTADWFTRGEKNFKALSIAQIAQSFSFLISVFFVVKHDLYMGAPWAISALVFLIFITLFNSTSISNLSGAEGASCHFFTRIYNVLSSSIFFTLSNGLSTLYQSLPVLILPLFFGVSSVAEVGMIFRIILAAVFIFSLPGLILFPYFASTTNSESNDQFWIQIRRLYFYFLLLAIALTGLLFYITVESLFYFQPEGVDSKTIADIIFLFLPFTVLRCSRTILVKFVNARGGERYYSKSMFLIVFVSIIMYMIFSVLSYGYFIYSIAIMLSVCEIYISFKLLKYVKEIG